MIGLVALFVTTSTNEWLSRRPAFQPGNAFNCGRSGELLGSVLVLKRS